MAFDWNGYLDMAKNLKARSDGQGEENEYETMRRVAISRAYYAVYHLAVDYAKAHFSYTPSQGGANQYHADIRAEYQRRIGNPAHQAIRGMLFQLHKARKDCDYNADGLGNIEALLGSVIIQADRIRETLGSISGE